MPSITYLISISSLACLAMIYWPSMGFISAIIWGITLLMGGKYLKDWLLILMLGFNLLLLYGLSGSSNLFFILIFGIPSLVMGLLLARNRTYYELQKGAVLAVVLLVSLFIGMTYYSPANTSPVYRQMEIDQSVAESLRVYEDSGFITFYEQQGVNPEEMKNDLVLITRWWFMHLPAFYYLLGILAGYLVLGMGEFISRKWSNPIIGRKPFREEMMPWQITGVVIVALILWLSGRDAMNNLYYAGSNLLLVALLIAVYYGLANLAYQSAKLKTKSQKLALSILFIGVMLFFPPAIIFVALLGLFDSLLDYRKLNQVKEDLR